MGAVRCREEAAPVPSTQLEGSEWGLSSAATAVALRRQHPGFGPQTGATTALGQSRAVHTCGWFACRIWGSSATAQAEGAPKCLSQEPSEGRFPDSARSGELHGSWWRCIRATTRKLAGALVAPQCGAAVCASAWSENACGGSESRFWFGFELGLKQAVLGPPARPVSALEEGAGRRGGGFWARIAQVYI
jgi:hypothetical protein